MSYFSDVGSISVEGKLGQIIDTSPGEILATVVGSGAVPTSYFSIDRYLNFSNGVTLTGVEATEDSDTSVPVNTDSTFYILKSVQAVEGGDPIYHYWVIDQSQTVDGLSGADWTIGLSGATDDKPSIKVALSATYISLIDWSNIVNISGSNQNDIINTSSALVGSAVHGWRGTDRLTGGDADDLFGDGSVDGDHNVIKGGGGIDSLRYSLDWGLRVNDVGIVINGGFDGTRTSEGDDVTGIEAIHATEKDDDIRLIAPDSEVNEWSKTHTLTYAGDDKVAGTEYADSIDTGLGTDRASGGDGNDLFADVAEADKRNHFDGGGGTDFLQYKSDIGALVGTIGVVINGGVDETPDIGDTVEGVEGIEATDFDDDIRLLDADSPFNLSFATATWTFGGDDRVRGTDAADYVDAGEDDDTFYGSAGDDELVGGSANDTYDFQAFGFDGFLDGTRQTLNGGSETGEKTDVNGGIDLLRLPGSADDYSYILNIAATWQETTTDVIFTAAPSVLYTLSTADIEQATFEDPFGNDVSLEGGNLISEMVQQAVEIYDGFLNDPGRRDWHPVAAIELGMRPTNFGTGSGLWLFEDGIFNHVEKVASFINDTTVSVLTGVVDGRTTLSISFAGSGVGKSFDLIDWVNDLTQARMDFYAKHRPLVDAIKAYLTEEWARIDQVVISGHSLGGAMVQHLIDELAADGLGEKVRGFTIGTIGGESETVTRAAGRITNFIHVDDIANLLSAPPFGEGRGGTKVILNTVIPIDFIRQHFAGYYQTDIQRLLNLSGDVFSPFFGSSLATALREGRGWTGDATFGNTIQVAPGSEQADTFRSRSADNFVLGGGGDDKFVMSGPIASRTRVFDGGEGDDQVFLTGKQSDYELTQVAAGGTTIELKPFLGLGGGTVGTFYRVEKAVFVNGVVSLDGSAISMQRIGIDESVAKGIPTYNINPAFDYASAGSGAMKIVGSAQDDIIFLGRGSKTIIGGGGDDIVIVRASSGNTALAETIFINGGPGADVMYGGPGKETFVVDNAGDVAIGNVGLDSIRSSVSWQLDPTVENLTLAGTAKYGLGNRLGNRITGNAQGNVLDGAAGNDIIVGGAGNDALTGGLGRDTQTGGTGRDIFNFNVLADSVRGANRDTIVDFHRSQHDRIDLSTIDADQRSANPGNDVFKFIGTQSFAGYHAAHATVFGMVRIAAGGIVQLNVNANLAADAEIKVTGFSNLAAVDFIL